MTRAVVKVSCTVLMFGLKDSKMIVTGPGSDGCNVYGHVTLVIQDVLCCTSLISILHSITYRSEGVCLCILSVWPVWLICTEMFYSGIHICK